jgi:hypothetical protein
MWERVASSTKSFGPMVFPVVTYAGAAASTCIRIREGAEDDDVAAEAEADEPAW